MRKLFVFLFCFAIANLYAQAKLATASANKPKLGIDQTLDQWHEAAAVADFELYFSYLTPDSRYMGTDASENWTVKEFKTFAKPYFERGKAWSFKAISRNIYPEKQREIAWFDELLDTEMGICRGSGVMVLVDGEWKIQHYVLSMTVPNDQADKVTALKKEKDAVIKKNSGNR